MDIALYMVSAFASQSVIVVASKDQGLSKHRISCRTSACVTQSTCFGIPSAQTTWQNTPQPRHCCVLLGVHHVDAVALQNLICHLIPGTPCVSGTFCDTGRDDATAGYCSSVVQDTVAPLAVPEGAPGIVITPLGGSPATSPTGSQAVVPAMSPTGAVSPAAAPAGALTAVSSAGRPCLTSGGCSQPLQCSTMHFAGSDTDSSVK